MTRRLRLSVKKQTLVTDHLQLVKILARYFVQNRAHWQRGVLVDDLEGEGYLALSKAARTYDRAKLPYPKAYFARAILNGMLKYIKRATRQPGLAKVSLQEAADLMPIFDNPDYLGLAISELPEEDKGLAVDRFQNGHTLRTIADGHQISLRIASVRSRLLAKCLAESLGIRLEPRGTATERRAGDTSQWPSSSSPASGDRRRKGPGR
jgi:DNA-directed RNA polymerase specialized sigma24 family protein